MALHAEPVVVAEGNVIRRFQHVRAARAGGSCAKDMSRDGRGLQHVEDLLERRFR
jgi:hypothetical protein